MEYKENQRDVTGVNGKLRIFRLLKSNHVDFPFTPLYNYIYSHILKEKTMNATLFGTLLKKLRKQENMNQEQLADTLGVSISAISKWETGKNLPDIEKITALANIFSISVVGLAFC